ncbi:glycosyltransferase family 2 protein [Cystobasidium minutum MCA 4210]|uniref:glycosyltransferase family 2 protein n=1 Tax=Cystobasidium minutum MCA 4210 TaxID=1397322 RepID=UPI0034CEF2B9|eukprot:jgi/Rhomi1/166481/fgenesh1_kg.2_\
MHWVISLAVLGGVLLLSSLFLLYQFSPAAFTSTPRPSVASERQYRSILSDQARPLPSINDDHDDSIKLTVIVPAYNEETRLPLMLDEALAHLSKNYSSDAYEILIVDDGSKDATFSRALEFAKENSDRGGKNIRVVKLAKNRGKGGAVTHGMMHSRGKRMLFVDADGASRFEDLALLEKAMDDMCSDTSSNGHTPNGLKAGVNSGAKAIAIGSRAHMVKTDAVVKRSKLRNLLMRSFHIYLSVLGIRSIADTQCGFKLFTRSIAREIFPNMHVEGWIFDIEILIIASLLDTKSDPVKMREVPIQWREVEGSKMDLIKDSISMAVDLLVIRASYALGRWNVKRVA